MTKPQKVFTIKAILWGTFFGGPLVTGILMFKNFKTFGEDYAAQRSLIISIILTAALLITIYFIPETSLTKIPGFFIPVVYTGIVHLILKNTQKSQIDEFLKKGGQRASNWTTFGYSILGILLIIIFIIAISVNLPRKGYEKEFNLSQKATLFYNKTLDKSIPESIAKAIRQSELVNLDNKQDLFLNKEGNYYVLKFVISDTKLLSDASFLQDFNFLEMIINKTAGLNKNIVFKFTNPSLSETYNLPFVELNIPGLHKEIAVLKRYHINQMQTIYYNDSVTESDLLIVSKAIKKLQSYFPPNSPLDMLFLDKGNYYEAKFFVQSPIRDGSYYHEIKNSIDYFKKAGIKKEIRIFLIDNKNYTEKEISHCR